MNQQAQEVSADPKPPLARYELETPYGKLRLEVHPVSPFYALVRLVAPFIGEWAGVEDEGLDADNDDKGNASDDSEVWEELSDYWWEDPDEFPQTPDEFVEYLDFAAKDIVRQFEGRIAQAAEALTQEADRYYKKHQAAPTLEWLIEHSPQGRTYKFKRRVSELVLKQFECRGQQLSLF